MHSAGTAPFLHRRLEKFGEDLPLPFTQSSYSQNPNPGAPGAKNTIRDQKPHADLISVAVSPYNRFSYRDIGAARSNIVSPVYLRTCLRTLHLQSLQDLFSHHQIYHIVPYGHHGSPPPSTGRRPFEEHQIAETGQCSCYKPAIFATHVCNTYQRSTQHFRDISRPSHHLAETDRRATRVISTSIYLQVPSRLPIGTVLGHITMSGHQYARIHGDLRTR